ncbi:hypothetical protein HU200_051108 [Digitaria exilis]|uniref:Uncharacterized protein n=1 Tax=Digitaria exilis TaxID=1010633 RepID=A0A835EAL9_9POAL|nr:hypothetical protein HU200_051108 [Digitaria exilis]
MGSLANAALAEKRWYAIASDPAVFRRFDALRRPPLLGFILTDRGDQLFPLRCSNLRFIHATRGYSNLASVAAGTDFFFEDLPDDDLDDGGWDADWRLRGCAGGRLLLSRGYDGQILAVYDPIARTAVFLHASTDFWPSTHFVNYAIVVDEADGSFLVIGIVPILCSAAVYSSRSGEWVKFEGDAFIEGYGEGTDDEWDLNDLDKDGIYEFPGGGKIPRRMFEKQDTIDSIVKIQADGMAAGRFAYWRSDTKKCDYSVERILLLDTSTMQWSVIAAPFPPGESYCVADMPEPVRSNA